MAAGPGGRPSGTAGFNAQSAGHPLLGIARLYPLYPTHGAAFAEARKISQVCLFFLNFPFSYLNCVCLSPYLRIYSIYPMTSRKHTLLPLLAGLVLLASACDKTEEETPLPESPVYDKEVTLQVFTETDYREARWHDSKVQLSLQLRRLHTGQNQQTVVLDTTLAWIPFQEIPGKAESLKFVHQFKQLHKEQEQLVLDVSKIVSINGYETVFEYDQTLDHAKQKETVEVKL